jgi:hypothetical protein
MLPAQAPKAGAGQARLAGTAGDLRAAEASAHSRMDDIVRVEVADRHATARDYERAGCWAHAEWLRGEAAVLSACLDTGQTGTS